MDADRLAQIRERMSKATPGPWAMDDALCDVRTPDGRTLIVNVLLGGEDSRERHPQATADVEFVAHSRVDISDLLAEVERLTAERDVLGDALSESEQFSYDDCRSDCDCGDHGPRSCGCHVTGAEAREWIRRAEDQRDEAAGQLAILRDRLRAAETVCTLFGWTASAGRSDRDKAVEQAWQDWTHRYGGYTDPSAPEWKTRIAELAARRDEIRERTLTRIRREASTAVPSEVPDAEV